MLNLKGKRLVGTNEFSESGRIDENHIKKLAGGTDEISGRLLFSNETVAFTPTFKIWIRTNHKPFIKRTDEAIWDRVHLIPFNVRIKDSDVDTKLHEKLRVESSGILNWCLNGFRNWWDIAKSGQPGYIHRLMFSQPLVISIRAGHNRALIDERGFIDSTAVCRVKEIYTTYAS